jgi:hypothetical protein
MGSEMSGADNAVAGTKSLRLQYADWLGRAAERARQRQILMHKEAAGEPLDERDLGATKTISDIKSGKIEILNNLQRLLEAWAQTFRQKLNDHQATSELGQRAIWRFSFNSINKTLPDRDEIIELGLDILFEEDAPRSEVRELSSQDPDVPNDRPSHN